MRLFKLLFILGMVVWFGVNPMSASAQLGTFEGPVWVPLEDSSKQKPLELQITVISNGKPVTKNVKVETIKKWVRTGLMPGETIPQWHQRKTNERSAASQEKSKEIAKAINAAFAAEFQQIGQQVTTETYKRVDPETALQGDFGMFIIPGISRDQKQPWRVVKDPTGQLGSNGGRFRPGVTIPSYGSMGSMGLNRSLLDNPFIATGYDPLNDPSVVQIGVEELYVARLNPSAGMTDEEILQTLESLLDINGIPATYNPNSLTLTLDYRILDGQTFIWGYSDPGLDYHITFESVVPEPASLGLVASGLFFVWRARRRGRHGEVN